MTDAPAVLPNGIKAYCPTAFAVTAVLTFALCLFAAKVFDDGDVWWHIASGQWMLDHRMIPQTDPFSATFAGREWHVHEWLAEQLFALSWRLGNWAGVQILTAAAAGLAIGLLHQTLRARSSRLFAAIASLLALLCLWPSITARPHLLAIPLLVGWARILLDARQAGRAPSLGWLLLLVLWANLHGSSLFGLGLVGLFALDALVAAGPGWRGVMRQWAPFCMGAGLALLLTPGGIEGAVFLLRLSAMPSLSFITEWQRPDFSQPQASEILVFAGIYLALTRRVRLTPVQVLIVLVTLHMALLHQRHQILLATVGMLVYCYGLQVTPENPAARDRRLLWLCGVLALALCVVRAWLPLEPRDGLNAPRNALAHVPAELRRQPVLNAYDAGGFLIAHGVRPFIDGRTDMYGDAFMQNFIGIVTNQPGMLDQALAQHHIAWTLLPVGSAAAQALAVRPGWQRIYADGAVAVDRRLP